MYIPGSPPVFRPKDDVIYIRYCHRCEMSQTTTATEPCWGCGGVVTHERPAYWPFSGSTASVTNGDAWGPGEEGLP